MRLRVLHLGKYDDVGGIERHVRSLLAGLAASGQVEPVNLVSNDRPRTEWHTKYGYPTVRAACWGSVASVAVSPALPRLALQLHREYRFDLVHLHFPDPLGQFAASLLPADVRRVVSWHSDIVRQRLALAMYQPLLSSFLRRSDAVVVASPYHFTGSTQMPTDLGDAQKVVIPFGMETAHFARSPASRSRGAQLRAERAAAGGRAVFALGRHVYYKGFDVLIRAMRHIDALLWLGGTGPLTGELQALVNELGLHSKVRFVGRVPDEELQAYYESCDVFVLPSVEKAEAFGLVQLEAMYCRRPVVSCRLGTGVDWVNQDGITGLVVPPRDLGALAGAVNRLLAEPGAAAAMGEAGRQRVDREFSLETMVRRMLALYCDVCGEPIAARAPA